MIYLALALLFLRFYLMDVEYSLSYMDSSGPVQETLSGNRTWVTVLVVILFGVGYYFLHQLMTDGRSLVPSVLIYAFQLIGFFLPQTLFPEQVEHEIPIFIMLLLVLAGAFMLFGSGLG